jgi:hypothetical protein
MMQKVLELYYQIKYGHYYSFGFEPNHHIYYSNYQKIDMAYFGINPKWPENKEKSNSHDLQLPVASELQRESSLKNAAKLTW